MRTNHAHPISFWEDAVPEPVDSSKAVPADGTATEPIATPCRALIQYWERFKVPKSKTPIPAPTTVDSSESSVVSVPPRLLPDNQLGDTMIQQEILQEANGHGDDHQPEATEAAGTAATLPPTEVVDDVSEIPAAPAASHEATPPAVATPTAPPAAPAVATPPAPAIATPSALAEPAAPAASHEATMPPAVATLPPVPKPAAPAAVATPPVLPEPMAPPAIPKQAAPAAVPKTTAPHVPLATPADVAAALSRATTVDLLGREPPTVMGHVAVPVPMDVEHPKAPSTIPAPAAVVPTAAVVAAPPSTTPAPAAVVPAASDVVVIT